MLAAIVTKDYCVLESWVGQDYELEKMTLSLGCNYAEFMAKVSRG